METTQAARTYARIFAGLRSMVAKPVKPALTLAKARTAYLSACAGGSAQDSERALRAFQNAQAMTAGCTCADRSGGAA